MLLVLYFSPYNLLEPEASFRAVSGKWFVSPVVRVLVYDRISEPITDWIDEVEEDWKFTSIIPCHFLGPMPAKPGDLSRAFDFSYRAVGRQPKIKSSQFPNLFEFLSGASNVAVDVPKEDLATLVSLTAGLKGIGIVSNAKK